MIFLQLCGGGGSPKQKEQNQLICDSEKGGEGVNKSEHFADVIRQGDQDTTKVGKCISRALSKVSAFAHPPSSVGVSCSSKRCLGMPGPHWMKPVAKTFERALDMRFPTFVVP